MRPHDESLVDPHVEPYVETYVPASGEPPSEHPIELVMDILVYDTYVNDILDKILGSYDHASGENS